MVRRVLAAWLGSLVITCAASAQTASALKLEALARQYLLPSSFGTPTLLTAEEWVTVQQQYRTYGKAQALDRQPRWQLP